ncbi:hypothetical protein LOC68_15385 [Blastopirellula sp. JC732]|uniref:Cellulose-binding protein n=1 Tax=Blastopirellula sediminis TaxID=2894196 RepID=A0A9X1SH68_9BACT|nr:hypothetical protein [Blastopirellula sediminis]MCC9606933.1 hypothetical protein [Blastopirellula sediminis]MCC9629772.1 hypothetical protein [Blastopirellula sediminis]
MIVRLCPALLFCLLFVSPLLAAEPAAKSKASLGMNLAGPVDWNTELPFVDVFRQSRPWVSQQQGSPWGQGPELALDEHGWVKSLESGCWAESPLCTIQGGHYPSGDFTVLYDGKGKLDFSGAAEVTSEEPGRLTLNVDAGRGGFSLQIRETDKSDYLRNIRVIMPGHVETYEQEPWNPAFLKLWRGVACLRFMDFMHTNDSTISTWAERPTMEDATWSQHGVPLEAMVDLVNRLECDAWFCMPHKADDDYVRRFAAQTKEKLDPQRKVYIEYSNEVWNGQFQQNRYAAEQGQKLGFADKAWEAAWYYTAYRSVEIFQIWQKEFGRQRLVRVLPSQAANPYVAQQILNFRDAAKQADALAIAPYLSMNLSPTGKPSSEEVASWTVDRLLDHAEQHSLPECTKWMEENHQLAAKHKLQLLAYEGGQHFVGVGGGESNEELTKLLHAANSNPRLGEIYAKYFAAWEANGGGIFCYFSSVGSWSKWGSWGALQSLDEDPADSPKYQAIAAWAQKLGQPIGE